MNLHTQCRRIITGTLLLFSTALYVSAVYADDICPKRGGTFTIPFAVEREAFMAMLAYSQPLPTWLDTAV